jgi:raffinose/stachyose/melibiose transport system permease protein
VVKIKYAGSTLFKYLTLLLAVLAVVVPIVVVFIASFKTSKEYLSTSPLALPENFLNFQNYKYAFIDGKMLLGYFNTVIILVAALLGATLLGSMVAFVINRFKFKGRNVILFLFLAAMMIPAITTQITTFQIVRFFGMYGTRWAPIVLFMGTDIISIYIFLRFMESISVSIDESAMIDGASYFRIYWNLILPLLVPAIVTVIIIKGVAIYNDFYIPQLYMPKKEMSVVSTALYRFQGPYGKAWEIISAGIVITIVPILAVFLFLQRYFYNGFTQGSIK